MHYLNYLTNFTLLWTTKVYTSDSMGPIKHTWFATTPVGNRKTKNKFGDSANALEFLKSCITSPKYPFRIDDLAPEEEFLECVFSQGVYFPCKCFSLLVSRLHQIPKRHAFHAIGFGDDDNVYITFHKHQLTDILEHVQTLLYDINPNAFGHGLNLKPKKLKYYWSHIK